MYTFEFIAVTNSYNIQTYWPVLGIFPIVSVSLVHDITKIVTVCDKHALALA